MRLPREFVERKLSAALNARVAIAGLSVSPLAGSVDVSGVTVTAHDTLEPILHVRRIKAEVALGAMLRKELVVKSVVIEGPVVTVVRGADGALNLPNRDAPTTTPNTEDAGDDAPSSWKLAAEKVQLLDGSVHYRDGDYHVCLDRVVGELLHKADGFHATVLAASLARRDEPVELGETRSHVVFRANELTALAAAPLDGTFDVGDVARGSIRSSAIADRRADVDVHAKLALAILAKLLPRTLAPGFRLDGQADVHVIATVDANEGLRIKILALSGSEITARPGPAGGAAGAATP